MRHSKCGPSSATKRKPAKKYKLPSPATQFGLTVEMQTMLVDVLPKVLDYFIQERADRSVLASVQARTLLANAEALRLLTEKT